MRNLSRQIIRTAHVRTGTRQKRLRLIVTAARRDYLKGIVRDVNFP
jgi:hypothetical protein